MEDTTSRRIREIRQWRGLSLRACAQLSGISHGYLGKLERGDKPLESRRVRESLARTLKVSPVELGGGPYAPIDEASNAAHESLDAIGAVLTEWRPGEVPDDGPARPWDEVHGDIATLIGTLRPTSNYAAMGQLVAGLIHDLLIYAADAQHREQALKGLVSTYHATGRVVSALGAVPLSYVIAERVEQAAQLLGDPEWLGVATWTRAHYMSSVSRPRQYNLAVQAAEMDGTRLESRGMGHLTAALAAAAQGDAETAETHLSEAESMATKLGLANSDWGAGTMNFGLSNVGTWRVSLGVELGEGPRVAELARDVQWQAMPMSRQGAYWMDLGRGLLQGRRTREQGLRALLHAEDLTPQQVRNNQFVRDAVSSMLTVARRDAGGAELRGLAWRMKIAPSG